MGRPMVWETCKVCKETNHYWFASLTYFPLLSNVKKEHQDTHHPLTYPTIYKAWHSTRMSTFTLAATLMLVPDTQSFPFIRVHASTDTRSCGRSADTFCNEMVDLPCLRLLRTNTSIYGPGQHKANAQCEVKRPNGCSTDPMQGGTVQQEVERPNVRA